MQSGNVCHHKLYDIVLRTDSSAMTQALLLSAGLGGLQGIGTTGCG